MELKIAQLLQNSRKDDLPPFSGRGNILRYSVQRGDFSMETADKSPSVQLMPTQNRNLTQFFKIQHKIFENMPYK